MLSSTNPPVASPVRSDSFARRWISVRRLLGPLGSISTPPRTRMRVETCTPIMSTSCLASEPAGIIGAQVRPLAREPPRQSQWPYFMRYVRSACPGRGFIAMSLYRSLSTLLFRMMIEIGVPRVLPL